MGKEVTPPRSPEVVSMNARADGSATASASSSMVATASRREPGLSDGVSSAVKQASSSSASVAPQRTNEASRSLASVSPQRTNEASSSSASVAPQRTNEASSSL